MGSSWGIARLASFAALRSALMRLAGESLLGSVDPTGGVLGVSRFPIILSGRSPAFTSARHDLHVGPSSVSWSSQRGSAGNRVRIASGQCAPGMKIGAGVLHVRSCAFVTAAMTRAGKSGCARFSYKIVSSDGTGQSGRMQFRMLARCPAWRSVSSGIRLFLSIKILPTKSLWVSHVNLGDDLVGGSHFFFLE